MFKTKKLASFRHNHVLTPLQVSKNKRIETKHQASNNEDKVSLQKNSEGGGTKGSDSVQFVSENLKTPISEDTNGLTRDEYITHVKKIAEIANKVPKLKLKVLSSGTIAKGTTLSINAQGIEGSLRNKKDGITYFGCKKYLKRRNKNGPVSAQLPSADPETAENHRGQHFQIEYHLGTNSYRIKDLGIGFGTFYKLDFPLVLKENHLINIGMTFMVINLTTNSTKVSSKANGNAIKNTKNQEESSNLEGPQLNLRFFGGPQNGEILVVQPSRRSLVLGRQNDCDLYINDNLLSKYQCTIEYAGSTGWILKDGKEKRPSTNGTWFYIGEEQTLYNGMIFRANQAIFQVSAH